MLILIKFKKSPDRHLLLDLTIKKAIQKVKDQINKGQYVKAIETTLSKGNFVKEVCDQDIPHVIIPLILTEDHAHRDLTS